MKFSKLCFGVGALFFCSHLYALNNITFDSNNCDLSSPEPMTQCISDEIITIHDRIPSMNFMEFLMFVRDYKFIKDDISFDVKLDLYERYWNNGQRIDSPFEVKRKTPEVEEAYQSVKLNALSVLKGIKTITLKNIKPNYYNLSEALFSRYDMDREVISLDKFHPISSGDIITYSRNTRSDFRFGYWVDYSDIKLNLNVLPVPRMIIFELPIEQAEKLFYDNKKPIGLQFDKIVFNIESFGLNEGWEGSKGGVRFQSTFPITGNTLYISEEDGQVLYIGSPAKPR